MLLPANARLRAAAAVLAYAVAVVVGAVMLLAGD